MKCPKCGHEAEAQSEQCAACGVFFHKLASQAAPPPPKTKAPPSAVAVGLAGAKAAVSEAREKRARAERQEAAATPAPVKLVDVQIPFWSLVFLMVKVAFAAIPAICIIFLIWVGLAFTLGSFQEIARIVLGG